MVAAPSSNPAAGWCLAILLLTSLPAAAQTGGSADGGRFTVSIGAGAVTGAARGARSADERTAGGAPYRLFNTESRLTTAGSLEARLGWALTPRISIEGRAGLSRPEMQTEISGDAEGAPSLTAVERIERYVFDGGVLVRFERWRVAGFVPFAAAGAGYLRQLHEDRTLVEQGPVYHVGGGALRWLSVNRSGLMRACGVRADARLSFFNVGASLGDDVRTQAAVSGSFVLAF
jgi:hypothetical protein